MVVNIVWFRRDLRLADNPALTFASKSGLVIPVYILDEDEENQWLYGGASRFWLHYSLKSLQKDLEERGLKLILRRGNPAQIIPEILADTKAEGVYWNRVYEPHLINRDKKLKEDLPCDVKSFNGSLLKEPWEVKNKSGDFYKVYSAFKSNYSLSDIGKSLFDVPNLSPYAQEIRSLSIDELELLPKKPNWSEKFQKYWQIGEKAAVSKLSSFVQKKLSSYADLRDFPSLDFSSKLSAHLHFGELSPHRIAAVLAGLLIKEDKSHYGLEKFFSELLWRDFSYYLLYHFPGLPSQPFKKNFAQFTWLDDDKSLKSWQKGETGYPIIDAGMRELWETGYMHNRVRMLVASFLTKNLLVSWQKGQEWFWDCLVDADLANNSASWQWVAGSGADAAPYFRIFNPILQSQKFDKKGEYIKKWVPELSRLETKFVHEPWLYDGKLNYPKPIIDYKDSRKRALSIYYSLS